MRRMLAATATLLGFLALATTAQAASLTYIKDHDVWISNADGGGAVRVTDDGTADEPWSSPTQSDDGIIAAVQGGFTVVLLRQNGERIRSFIPEVLRDNLGAHATGGVHGLGFSPDGRKLVFAQVSLNCSVGIDCMARGVSAVMDLEGRQIAQQDEFIGAFPSWVSDELVLSHGGFGSQNLIWRYRTQEIANWFDDYDLVASGLSTDMGDGQLSDDHSTYVALRGYDETLSIATYAVNGDVTAARPALPTLLCFGTGQVSAPTVSGDGDTAYWQEPDGVWTMAVSPECPNGRLLIPGASEPDWSAAAVDPQPRTDVDHGSKGKGKGKKACKRLKGKRRKACLKRAGGRRPALARIASAAGTPGLPPGVIIPKVTPLVLTKADYRSSTEWAVIPGDVDECTSYVRGSGTQEVSIELKQPTPISLIEMGATTSLSPPGRQPVFTSVATRLGDWDPHFVNCACGPSSEYGPCDDEPEEPTYDCTPKRNGTPRLEIRNYDEGDPIPGEGMEAWKDMIVVKALGGRTFGESCPPLSTSIPLGTDSIAVIDGERWLARLAALRPGGRGLDVPWKMAYGMSQRRGGPVRHTYKRCPPKPKDGAWMCKVNSATLHFERR